MLSRTEKNKLKRNIQVDIFKHNQCFVCKYHKDSKNAYISPELAKDFIQLADELEFKYCMYGQLNSSNFLDILIFIDEGRLL